VSVYYVHAPETGLVKIGFARDALNRFTKMQVDSPTRLILLAVEDGSAELENARHREFAVYRVRGEWFRLEGALADHVAALPPFVRPPRKPLDGALGTWLRKNGQTLSSFAERIDTSEATLSRICCGKQFPRRAMMLRIIEATDWQVDANALLGIPPRPRKAAA
jgi:hypothetical protein